jgi:hypothetical protein
MATFTFTIPNATLTRISNSLDKVGYKFDASLGTTDTAQRTAFFKQYTIALWQSDLFNYERQVVIDAGGNPATQAKNFGPLTDVTAA